MFCSNFAAGYKISMLHNVEFLLYFTEKQKICVFYVLFNIAVTVVYKSVVFLANNSSKNQKKTYM